MVVETLAATVSPMIALCIHRVHTRGHVLILLLKHHQQTLTLTLTSTEKKYIYILFKYSSKITLQTVPLSARASDESHFKHQLWRSFRHDGFRHARR